MRSKRESGDASSAETKVAAQSVTRIKVRRNIKGNLPPTLSSHPMILKIPEIPRQSNHAGIPPLRAPRPRFGRTNGPTQPLNS